MPVESAMSRTKLCPSVCNLKPYTSSLTNISLRHLKPKRQIPLSDRREARRCQQFLQLEGVASRHKRMQHLCQGIGPFGA